MSARYCFFDGHPISSVRDGFAYCEAGHIYGDDFLDTLERLIPEPEGMSMDDVVVEGYGWVGAPDRPIARGAAPGWYAWRHRVGGEPTEWSWYPIDESEVPENPGPLHARVE